MRIATFNCNSIRQRLSIVLDWLEANRPDVLALQETKVADELFPATDFMAAGWEVAFRGQKAYNGVALVSREPLQEVTAGLRDGDGGESDSRLIAGCFGDTWIVNTYIPQGADLDSPKFAFKLEWYARFRNWLEQRFAPRQDSVLWLGDLNVAPTDIDVYAPKTIWPHVCFCQEAIDAWQNVVDWGFTDIFRKHLPEPGHFTYFDYRLRGGVESGKGWRIDHLLATAALAARSSTCRVDLEPRRREKPSDHTFVVADFD